MQVAYVEEAVFALPEVNKSGLYSGFDIYHFSLVDVSNVTVEACPLDVKLFEIAVFDDRDPAFFGFSHIYEHFSCHFSFLFCKKGGKVSSSLRSRQRISLVFC